MQSTDFSAIVSPLNLAAKPHSLRKRVARSPGKQSFRGKGTVGALSRHASNLRSVPKLAGALSRGMR